MLTWQTILCVGISVDTSMDRTMPAEDATYAGQST